MSDSDQSESIYDYQPFSKSNYDDVGAESNDFSEIPVHQEGYGGIEGNQVDASGAISEGELRAKAMELARREAELEQRELDVANREDDMTQTVQKKNWPRCYPILDHSYTDIPTKKRKVVAWIGYILWYIFCATLVFNFFTSIITLFAPGKADLFSNLRFVIFSTVLLFIGIPFHFALSYWPLYKAMRHGNVPRYCLFFVGYSIPILFCLFALGGWYDYGVGGIIVIIQYWPTVAGSDENPSYVAFVPNLILSILWTLLCVAFIAIFIVVIIMFRRQKHTLKDVQKLAQDSTRDAMQAVTTRLGQAAVNSYVQRGNTQGDDSV